MPTKRSFLLKQDIPNLRFEILQRYCTLNFKYFRHAWSRLSNMMGISGYDHQKRRYQLIENSDVYLHAKNQIYLSPASRDIAKLLQTWYFGYFGHAQPHPSKTIVST